MGRGLNKHNRASISFSEVGDADLITILKNVNYNFAGFCKELMRDGMKYRGISTEVIEPKIALSVPVEPRKGTIKKSIPQINNEEQLKKHVANKLDKF